MTFKSSKTFGSFLGRAQPNWAYEFPDRTGPDTQICCTSPALDIHFKTFTHQITEFHWSSSNWNFSFKKVNKQKRIWNKRNFKSLKKKNILFYYYFFGGFLKVLKVWSLGRKTSRFRTVRFWQFSGLPDMMSGRALFLGYFLCNQIHHYCQTILCKIKKSYIDTHFRA